MFLLNSRVGKDWAGPFFPPPPLGSNLSIYLSVLGLIYSYTESEHFYGHSPPSADLFKKGCCQLQAKVCAQITG